MAIVDIRHVIGISPNLAIVAGRADLTVGNGNIVNGIQAQLAWPNNANPQIKIEGRTFYFRRFVRGSRRIRWAIAFPIPASVCKRFELQIELLTSAGQVMTLPVQMLPRDLGHCTKFSLTSSPTLEHPSSSPYTLDTSIDEQNFFCVYGATDALMTAATLTKSDSTIIQADMLETSDPPETWFACFPPLTTGTYVLMASSSGGSITPVTCIVP